MSRILFIGAALFLMLTLQTGARAQDARFRVPVNGGTVPPCHFDQTDCYGTGHHTGVDYYSSNRDILATAPGKVFDFYYDNYGGTNSDHSMGNTIIIEHRIVNEQGGSETLYSQYSHLASFIPGLYRGEAVVKGQKIGTMGDTGGPPWGVHLHFEIKRSPILGSAPYGYWGYTPNRAAGYGYINPQYVLNSGITALGEDYAFWDFTGTDNLEGWSLWNIEGWAVGNGILYYNPQGADPFITSPDLFVDANALSYVQLRFSSRALDSDGYVYFKTSEENSYNEDKKVYFRVRNCPLCGSYPDYQDYSVYMGNHPKWNGRKITGIRIDPAYAGVGATDNDLIRFNSIRLSGDAGGGDMGGAADEIAPDLTISGPADGQVFTSSLVFVNGTATDAGRGESGIASVTVSGARASNDTASQSGTANWSGGITLNPGTNNITVVARDNSAAQNVATKTITVYYQTAGPTPTPTPTPPATAPTFTSSASANPNPATVGQSVSVQSAFNYSSTGGAADVIVNTEIYNAADQRVFQGVSEHQNFSAGQTLAFAYNWTPSATGDYKVKTSVFNHNWAITYHWNDTALTITVGSASPTPPPTPPAASPSFSSTATASPNPALVATPVGVSATVTNSGGSASDVIVDVEIYNAADVKVFQSVYEHRNFAASSSQTFTPSWTPAATGQYTVKIGVFSNDWSKSYSWNANAATISISSSSQPLAPAYNISVWWVADGATVSGTQPFKAVIDNLSLSQYQMFWQVDGGGLIPMSDSLQDAPHKESMVDLSGWTWRGTGPYTVNFVAKDSSGSNAAQRAVSIYVSP